MFTAAYADTKKVIDHLANLMRGTPLVVTLNSTTGQYTVANGSAVIHNPVSVS
jgi:hypothetical protein